MRSRDSLRRRRWSREPIRRYLIVCEGKVTEKEYSSDLRVLNKIPIHITFIAGAVPKTLVERAVAMGKGSQEFDEIWAVFDVDTHPSISEAKKLARENGVSVAVSNPCFELWALLHFQDQTAHISPHEVQRLCRKYLPRYEKKLPCAELMPLYPEALRRAELLRRSHQLRGTVGSNPSTDVFELVRSIKAQRRDWRSEG